MDGRGLSNKMCHKFLPDSTQGNNTVSLLHFILEGFQQLLISNKILSLHVVKQRRLHCKNLAIIICTTDKMLDWSVNYLCVAMCDWI